MRLRAEHEIPLGDRSLAFPHPPTACLRADGSALAVVSLRGDAGWRTEIVHLDETGVRARAELPERRLGAEPVIVDRAEAGVTVLVDDGTAVVFDDALETPRTVRIRVGEGFAEHGGVTRGGIARRSAAGTWLVVLSDPLAFQNARTVAELRLDGEDATWMRWSLLDERDYPMGGIRSGIGPGGVRAPIVGDVVDVEGARFVCAEGADAMSVNKYGADSFTLAQLDGGDRVVRRLYEERDWAEQPGKHGILGRFTSDGTRAILTPVFASGPWKGRSRIVRLGDGAPEEVAPIRGMAGFRLVDVRAGRALLASADALLFAALADG